MHKNNRTEALTNRRLLVILFMNKLDFNNARKKLGSLIGDILHMPVRRMN